MPVSRIVQLDEGWMDHASVPQPQVQPMPEEELRRCVRSLGGAAV